MQIHVAPPVSSLIVDPLCIGHFGSLDAMLEAILKDSSSVALLEREMLKAEQMPCPVIHRFAPGLYIREINMPAGAFAIGAYHHTAHLNIMMKGRLTILSDNGSITELKAPMMFVSQPGQKIGYVHEDTVWQNIFATDETDIETLEAMYVDKGRAWRVANEQRLQRSALLHEADRSDYWRVLAEFGVSHTQARRETEHIGDTIPFPHGGYKVMVSDSPIDGRGLFATAAIAPDEVIAPARVRGCRTPAWRYTNHSIFPNARFVMRQNGDLDLVATRQISGMQGGMPGDEITIDYRHALTLRKLL